MAASAGPGRWPRRSKLAAGAGAVAAAALVAFGVFAAFGGLSGASASSVIPSPPARNKVFVGGPVASLSGQTVGINVGGAGSGLHATGLAIPINRALAVAKELQSRAAH